MKNYWIEITGFTVLMVMAALAAALVYLTEPPQGRAAVVQAAREASVAVILNGGGHGSGVVLTADGRIITAGHVCEGEESLTVQTYDGKKYPAEILWIGGQADLCLIRSIGGQWRPVSFAAEPAVGDVVFHVGHYIENLLAFGNIGAPATGHDERFALTFVGVAGPGSSGGGVFDMTGRLVGLIYSGPEISFPIGDRMGMGQVRIPKGLGHIIPARDIAFLLLTDDLSRLAQ